MTTIYKSFNYIYRYIDVYIIIMNHDFTAFSPVLLGILIVAIFGTIAK